MMKKAGSDSTIMEYRLHLVLTSKELEETAEKYHFSGMDVRTGMEELQGIHEMLCKAADCRTVCMVEKENGKRRPFLRWVREWMRFRRNIRSRGF